METRMLDNIQDLYIKEKDKPNFDQVFFAPTLIRDKYMVFNSEIFYLHSEQPLMDGILDMEELLEQKDASQPDQLEQRLVKGAIDMDGS